MNSFRWLIGTLALAACHGPIQTAAPQNLFAGQWSSFALSIGCAFANNQQLLNNITVQPDGTYRAFFGNMTVTGTIAADGTFSGSYFCGRNYAMTGYCDSAAVCEGTIATTPTVTFLLKR